MTGELRVEHTLARIRADAAGRETAEELLGLSAALLAKILDEGRRINRSAGYAKALTGSAFTVGDATELRQLVADYAATVDAILLLGGHDEEAH